MVASEDTQAPLVVIVGITGGQGGSVANHLIESTMPYRLVGLTRDASKSSAQRFADKGVKLQEVSIEVGNEVTVAEAFEGADVLFAMTNTAELMSPVRELAQGKLMVDAAKAAGVKLFIWSSLVSIDKISHGTLACFPFDVKAEIAEYLKASGVPYAAALPGWFFKNLYWGPNMPVKQADGTYVLTMPVPASTKTPIIDVELDYGRYVRAVIEKPWLGAGSEIVTGTMISFEDQMAQLSEYTGKTFKFKQVDYDEFQTLGLGPMADVAYNMTTFFSKFGFYGGEDLEASHRVTGITPPTFAEMLSKHKPEEFLQ